MKKFFLFLLLFLLNSQIANAPDTELISIDTRKHTPVSFYKALGNFSLKQLIDSYRATAAVLDTVYRYNLALKIYKKIASIPRDNPAIDSIATDIDGKNDDLKKELLEILIKHKPWVPLNQDKIQLPDFQSIQDSQPIHRLSIDSYPSQNCVVVEVQQSNGQTYLLNISRESCTTETIDIDKRQNTKTEDKRNPLVILPISQTAQVIAHSFEHSAQTIAIEEITADGKIVTTIPTEFKGTVTSLAAAHDDEGINFFCACSDREELQVFQKTGSLSPEIGTKELLQLFENLKTRKERERNKERSDY
ncbi:MAG: hypothetical protein EBU90_13180 [Proteobacteria bacterium]|nr:hypothetical protein [Pseudomonadota bacterium]NBP15736.1 hypothetical protein [bacterium]